MYCKWYFFYIPIYRKSTWFCLLTLILASSYLYNSYLKTEQWAPFLFECPKSWYWVIRMLNFSDSPGPPRRSTARAEQWGRSFLRCAPKASRGRANPPFLDRVKRMRGLPTDVGPLFPVRMRIWFPQDQGGAATASGHFGATSTGRITLPVQGPDGWGEGFGAVSPDIFLNSEYRTFHFLECSLCFLLYFLMQYLNKN